MYFSKRSHLKQPHYKEPETYNPIRSNPSHSLEFAGRGAKDNGARPDRVPLCSTAEFGAKDVLNTANNRLQELMQLLYLLSRDPAVPNDARFHVTLAQSEIALLVRIMRNAEEAHNNATKLPAADPPPMQGNL
jgi:hypothetical protein